MKLDVTLSMPLPENSAPFLMIIAKAHGYEGPAEQAAINQFVCEHICKQQMLALFRTIITNALAPYYGIANSAEATKAVIYFDEQAVVTSTIS
jgi:hypothetical protein